jgi:hypothetical protein
MSGAGLTPEAAAFAAKYRAQIPPHNDSAAEPYVPERLSQAGQLYRDHLRRMTSEHDYATTVSELRKDCERCDMEIAEKLSKCKDSGCSVMGGKRRSNMRSKKNRRRRTTSRRRSRARR